jgi:hypothetical protein
MFKVDVFFLVQTEKEKNLYDFFNIRFILFDANKQFFLKKSIVPENRPNVYELMRHPFLQGAPST